MKRLIALALTMFALAAVPVAFGDDTTPTAPATTTPVTQVRTGAPGNSAPARIAKLRLEVKLVAKRFGKRCNSGSTSVPQACLDFAQKAQTRLAKLDTNLLARIAKVQAACPAGSTDPSCKNADRRIALFQKIDARVQAEAQKVQDWLAGKTAAPATTTP